MVIEELKNVDFSKIREDEEKKSLKYLINNIELFETSFILKRILKRGGYSSYLFNEKSMNEKELILELKQKLKEKYFLDFTYTEGDNLE
jgi:hypothetical protein